jgi:CheY-like chemotaxis protein
MGDEQQQQPQPEVLLVEDDNDLRESLRSVIDSLGEYHVLTARNGGEALRELKQHPGVALVLTDLSMPGMNGWQLVQALAALGYDKDKIVVITAVNPGPLPDGIRIVRKPVPINELLEAMRAAVGNRALVERCIRACEAYEASVRDVGAEARLVRCIAETANYING